MRTHTRDPLEPKDPSEFPDDEFPFDLRGLLDELERERRSAPCRAPEPGDSELTHVWVRLDEGHGFVQIAAGF